jgi:hypothetical protein
VRAYSPRVLAENPLTDDTDRKSQELAAANAERTRVDDLKWVMTSPRGRRLIGWLLNSAGVNDPSFNNSGSITAFNEGKRALGLVLLTEVQRHAFGNYVLMLTEGEEQRAKSK